MATWVLSARRLETAPTPVATGGRPTLQVLEQEEAVAAHAGDGVNHYPKAGDCKLTQNKPQEQRPALPVKPHPSEMQDNKFHERPHHD